jgi:hypothetical protein
MSKVITFSRVFPKYHPKAGQPTYFVEKLLSSINYKYYDEDRQFNPRLSVDSFEPKHHTIRNGNRWKVGDKFSPRVWSGKPYQSKQIIIAPDIEIVKIWDFEITTEDDDGEHDWSFVEFLGKHYTAYGYGGYDDKIMVEIAKNDGLTISDFYDWFLTRRTKQQRLENKPKIFKGQIICWNPNINY